MVRSAIESLYSGRCSITQHQKVFNNVTKITSFKDVVVCESEPCRLSYQTPSTTRQGDDVAMVEQSITLFVRPELIIEAGSKITVTQNGRTVKYVASGQPRVYSNHQEIRLELRDVKA